MISVDSNSSKVLPSSQNQQINSSTMKPQNSTHRLIRSFTLFDNRDFLLRPFQIELYEACKNRDTIVFLRPGQGRYFIAVMLVKYFAPYRLPNAIDSESLSNKKIFFLAKTIDSIRMYSSVFRAHTDLTCAEYLNSKDDFQSEEAWSRNLVNYDIHLMLDEMFESLLNHGLVDPTAINLLILDDVYKILLHENRGKKDDCYVRIVRHLKTRVAKSEKNYRILGLSASILLKNVSAKIFKQMIEQIESSLECSCETYADLRMINKYSIQSRIKLRFYQPLLVEKFFPSLKFKKSFSSYCLSLVAIRNYVAQYYISIANLTKNTISSSNDQIVTNHMLCRVMLDILSVLGTLGEWCAIKYIDLVLREINETIILFSSSSSSKQSNYLRLLHSTLTTLVMVRKSILSYLSPEISCYFNTGVIDKNSKMPIEKFFALSSPKLHLLAKLLSEYLEELLHPTAQTPHSSFTFPANICALIYASQQTTARVVASWLSELAAIVAFTESTPSSDLFNLVSNLFGFFQPEYAFLHENTNDSKNFYYRKQQKSLHEIYYYRHQEETLRRFRLANNCNLLVTTSMAAEGLDVNRCNLVVCFDPPKTFHQFIQSKGRVRVEKGQFVVMLEKFNDDNQRIKEDDVHRFLEYHDIEKIFSKLVPLNNQIDIIDECEDEPKIEENTNKIQNLSTKKFLNEPESSNSNKISFSALVKRSIEFTASCRVANETSGVSGNDSVQVSTKTANFTSGVQLTMDNAISILNRYCNKLPSDTFTKLVPNYRIEEIQTLVTKNGQQNQILKTKRYRCRLYLPINSTYRDEIVGEERDTPLLAKQTAAHQTVRTLREIGELDHNYYPIGKETSRYIEKLGLQDCFINTRSIHGSHNIPTNHHHFRHHHPKGSRYNRIHNRNIASKRRQYYTKKVSDVLSNGQVFLPIEDSNTITEMKKYRFRFLYHFDLKLTCPLPEEQNSRGRRIIDPSETMKTFGILVPDRLPRLCDFTIYNRSGEVTVSVKPIEVSESEAVVTLDQIKSIHKFHFFTFENVLQLAKTSMRFDETGQKGSNGNYLIVPIDRLNETLELNTEKKSIDWEFIDLIAKYADDPSTFDEKLFRKVDDTSVALQSEKFIFHEQLYRDSVVIPKYRRDKLQAFYYVAEICHDLTPLSSFPGDEFESFEEYYRLKYFKKISNLEQPLLDVDHTSARLNLLTPRFLNRKGVVLPAPRAINPSHTSKRIPQQKQILVPELCDIHPFPASFWRKAVLLPCILYRLNSLLMAEELRSKISTETSVGCVELPKYLEWPKLDFGWAKIVEQARQRKLQLESVKLDDKSHKTDDDSFADFDQEECELQSNENLEHKTVSNVENDFVIDTFDPSCLLKMPPPSQPSLSFDEQQDYWFSQLSTNVMPQIEILSFSSTDISPSSIHSEELFGSKKFEQKEAAIYEVDDQGLPIQDKKISQESEKTNDVRAGSPTYWRNLKFDFNDQITSNLEDFDWTSPVGTNQKKIDHRDNTTVSSYSLNIDELSKDISDLMLNNESEALDEEYFDHQNATNNDNVKKSYSETRNRSKKSKSSCFTSLSDLEDDVDDDDAASYSDFDLEDDSDGEDDDDEDEDDEDDDDIDDDDDDENENQDDDDFDDRDANLEHDIGWNSWSSKSSIKKKSSLATNLNTYQLKSVIYDILKYELLYDSKQIDNRSLNNYYKLRFALIDEPEALQKRRLFEELYQKEKRLVRQCVEKISIHREQTSSQGVIDSSQIYNIEKQPVVFDSNIDPSKRLIDILLEKIDTTDVFLNEPDSDEENEKLIQEQQLKDGQQTSTNESMSARKSNKSDWTTATNRLFQDGNPFLDSSLSVDNNKEIKFGELLPNRDQMMGKSMTAMVKNQSESSNISVANQGELSISNTPIWLCSESGSTFGEKNSQVGPHPSLILQAITMSNSSDGINLERLETVGDSFLKYSITAFLFCMCPELNEGKLSFLRSRQISNINLHRLGQRINLGQLMIASKFEPMDNWCPPSYQVLEMSQTQDKSKVPYNLLIQHSIPNKSIADCVEALIGTYLISTGSHGAIKFMDWLGLKVLPKFSVTTNVQSSLDDLVSNRQSWLPQPKSPLIISRKHQLNKMMNGLCLDDNVASVQKKLNEIYYKHHLDRFELILGYKFRDRAYLVQAFTHNSYHENTITDCYQRLEFLGDAVLDYLITRYLYEDSRGHSPGTLTDLRSALVNNTFFAALAVKYQFQKYLMMLSSELYRVIDGFVRKFNIYYNLKNYQNNNDDQTKNDDSNEIDEISANNLAQQSFTNNNKNNTYNYLELFISENEAEHLEDVEVPKALGDIFESVAGAIYLDSGMSLEAVWQAYYPMMKPEIENFSDNVPKSPIRVLLERKPQSVKFSKPEVTSGRRIRVTVEVFGLGKFVGVARNKRIAKCTAAKRALRALESEKRREFERKKRSHQSRLV